MRSSMSGADDRLISTSLSLSPPGRIESREQELASSTTGGHSTVSNLGKLICLVNTAKRAHRKEGGSAQRG